MLGSKPPAAMVTWLRSLLSGWPAECGEAQRVLLSRVALHLSLHFPTGQGYARPIHMPGRCYELVSEHAWNHIGLLAGDVISRVECTLTCSFAVQSRVLHALDAGMSSCWYTLLCVLCTSVTPFINFLVRARPVGFTASA